MDFPNIQKGYSEIKKGAKCQMRHQRAIVMLKPIKYLENYKTVYKTLVIGHLH